jgi:membrane fusion protein (multidrug efflux system)
MNKNSRFGIVALAIAGIVGLGFYAYTANRASGNLPAAPAGSTGKATGAGGPPGGVAMAVEVARVKVSNFSDDASAVGNLKSVESVVLRPETAGSHCGDQFSRWHDCQQRHCAGRWMRRFSRLNCSRQKPIWH